MFRDKKSQQQTLSIRVSESVREFLDRARRQFSDARGENMSISDVAKALLESAIENQMDDRLETTFLLAEPTETLLKIRRKWESTQDLTRAEWIVLAQFVQSACEDLSTDPELPSRESCAAIPTPKGITFTWGISQVPRGWRPVRRAVAERRNPTLSQSLSAARFSTSGNLRRPKGRLSQHEISTWRFAKSN
jgi:hypothetical protein